MPSSLEPTGDGLPPGNLDFGALVRVLHEGVWALDRDGITLYANPQMGAMLGVDSEALRGRAVLDFFLEDDHELIRERIRRRRTGQSDEYEARLLRSDGSIAHVLVHGSPLERDGHQIGSVAAITDITELRRIADELQIALAEADAARETRTRLMSWVAHELRTPLNSITGFAQLLATGALGDRERKMVDSILMAGEHVNALVQDLLDFTRVDSNVAQIEVRPTPIDPAVREALTLVAGTADEHSVTFDVQMADDEPADRWVLADHRRLVVVLVNLLSNAAKYGGDGSTVTVTVRSAGDAVAIDVTDRGPGIALHLQRDVFVPFGRLENAQGIDGVGLGLAIARSSTEAMRGTLSLRSAPGEGTSFTITLPRADRPDTTDHTPTAPAASSALILYVEDEPMNATLVESIVELLPGRSLRVETTVEAGLAALRETEPALVLLDLNLPDGSGFDVLSWIRGQERFHSLPVYILSADATEQSTRRAAELGVDRFVTKPFDLGEFLELLDGATRGG